MRIRVNRIIASAIVALTLAFGSAQAQQAQPPLNGTYSAVVMSYPVTITVQVDSASGTVTGMVTSSGTNFQGNRTVHGEGYNTSLKAGETFDIKFGNGNQYLDMKACGTGLCGLFHWKRNEQNYPVTFTRS
jgi:hypothetical protein